MLKYALKDRFTRNATVSIDVSTPHDRATIIYSGDEMLVEQVERKLTEASGAFGHGIEDCTSAIDLDYALSREEFKEYSPQMIEGKEIISKGYNPEIPEGAVT